MAELSSRGPHTRPTGVVAERESIITEEPIISPDTQRKEIVLKQNESCLHTLTHTLTLKSKKGCNRQMSRRESVFVGMCEGQKKNDKDDMDRKRQKLHASLTLLFYVVPLPSHPSSTYYQPSPQTASPSPLKISPPHQQKAPPLQDLPPHDMLLPSQSQA